VLEPISSFTAASEPCLPFPQLCDTKCCCWAWDFAALLAVFCAQPGAMLVDSVAMVRDYDWNSLCLSGIRRGVTRTCLRV
jgi:hypothetical protein